MDLQTLISSVGFPIFSFLVTCVACKYVYDTENKQNDVLVNENMKRLEQLTLAVNNNTETIAQLVSNMTSKED